MDKPWVAKFKEFSEILLAKGWYCKILDNELGMMYWQEVDYGDMYYKREDKRYVYYTTKQIMLCRDENRNPVYHWTWDYVKGIDGYFDDVDAALAYFSMVED